MAASRFVIEPIARQVYHRSVTVSEHREVVNGRLVVEQFIRIEHEDPQPIRTFEDILELARGPSAALVAATQPAPTKSREISGLMRLAQKLLNR